MKKERSVTHKEGERLERNRRYLNREEIVSFHCPVFSTSPSSPCLVMVCCVLPLDSSASIVSNPSPIAACSTPELFMVRQPTRW